MFEIMLSTVFLLLQAKCQDLLLLRQIKRPIGRLRTPSYPIGQKKRHPCLARGRGRGNLSSAFFLFVLCLVEREKNYRGISHLMFGW